MLLIILKLLLLLYTTRAISATANTSTASNVLWQQPLLLVRLQPAVPVILLQRTPTQTNPTHLSPEQAGSACLIRLRAAWRDQLVLEKKGLKELLTRLNSHPFTRTYTPWAVTCEITPPLVRFVSEGLYQLLNVPWRQVRREKRTEK